MLDTTTALFSVGQLVQHRMFEYRGVIIDVDPYFKGTDDWYDHMAHSHPPKDRPWYHVLVDGGDLKTYVAERNLEPAPEGTRINHPEVADHFTGVSAGGYVSRRKSN